jgi:TolB-like protein
MPISEQDVRAELDRILVSKGFTSAARISKLLRHVVDKTLAGETDQLKEYAVGMEVFDRDASYDPRIDSIVRVEAGRLRSRLAEYYNADGKASPIRIHLPKGGYSAEFAREAERQAATTATSDAVDTASNPGRTSRTWPYALALVGAIAAMVFWLAIRDGHPRPDLRPTAAVMPIEANMIGGDNDNYSALMTEAITTELARLGTISVASFTSSMQFAGRRPSMSEVNTALKSRYVIEASVDDEAAEILVVARIVDAETNRKMWVSDYRGARDDVRGIAQRIAYDVSAAILQKEATR